MSSSLGPLTSQVEVVYLVATGSTYHMTDPEPVDTVDPELQARTAFEEHEDAFAFFYRSDAEIRTAEGLLWQFQESGIYRSGKFFIAPRVNYFSRKRMLHTPDHLRTHLLALVSIEGSPELIQYPSGRFIGFHPVSDQVLVVAAA